MRWYLHALGLWRGEENCHPFASLQSSTLQTLVCSPLGAVKHFHLVCVLFSYRVPAFSLAATC